MNSPHNITTERLGEWHASMGRLYLTAITTVMPLIIALWLASRSSFRVDGPAAYITLAWLCFVGARVFAPPRFQAMLVVGLSALIGATGPMVLGLSPGPFLATMSAAILASALFDRRLAFALLAMDLAALLLIGTLASRGAIPWMEVTPTDPTQFSNWLRLTAFTALTTVPMIFVLTGLLERMEAAWRATAEAAERERVAAEHSRAAEERSVEAQRLEAIGRLAGGVAHDFNNQLMVIMSWADLLPTTTSEAERREGLDAIRDASAQAAQLTRQLLSFARKGAFQLGAVDVEATLTNAVRSLRRLLPSDVTVEYVPGSVPLAHADAAQLSQVVLNLAVNARDAMPRGGTVTLRTTLLAPPHLPPEAPDQAGRYVAISVTDTGVGMDEVTRLRVFEPFFTTKEHGRGTGLGLAMVYGVARQAHGFAQVQSRLGEGSTFTVAFPVAPSGAQPALEPSPLAPVEAAPSTHRILLVEDNPIVRATMARALRKAGIDPLEASDAEEALQLARRHTAELDLLCTDGVMPGMPTHVLIEGFRQLYPHAPILVCSGHVEEELLVRGIIEGTVSALPKPFTGDALVARVNQLLSKRPAAG